MPITAQTNKYRCQRTAIRSTRDNNNKQSARREHFINCKRLATQTDTLTTRNTVYILRRIQCYIHIVSLWLQYRLHIMAIHTTRLCHSKRQKNETNYRRRHLTRADASCRPEARRHVADHRIRFTYSLYDITIKKRGQLTKSFSWSFAQISGKQQTETF